MKYFTIEQRETLEQQLKSRATELRREIDDVLEHADGDRSGPLASRFQKIEDEAVADLEQCSEFASLQRELRELGAIKEAMRRLHSPDFGVCMICNTEIPYARLTAQPIATRCRACEALAERPATQPLHAAL